MPNRYATCSLSLFLLFDLVEEKSIFTHRKKSTKHVYCNGTEQFWFTAAAEATMVVMMLSNEEAAFPLLFSYNLTA